MPASYQSPPVASTTLTRFTPATARRLKAFTPPVVVAITAHAEAAGKCRSYLPASRMLGSLRTRLYGLDVDEQTVDRAVAELARLIGFARGVHQ